MTTNFQNPKNIKTEKKIALITGASQRIGAAIATNLHAEDFNILIHYRHSDKAANELITKLNNIRPNSAKSIQGDLANTTEAINVGKNAINIWGRIDVIVNNASSFYPTLLETVSEKDWDNLIGSNLKGPFFLSKTLANTLSENNGCIINLVDIYSEKPLANHPVYCIAKAGVAMMTKTLAKELAPNVRVNGISPGAILWPDNDVSDDEKLAILDKVPLKRTGESEDIANLAVHLIVKAPYITGQIIAVDGGRSLHL